MVAIQIVEHHHVEGGGRGALLPVSADVHLVVVAPVVGELVDQPRIAVKGENNRLVLGEQRVVLPVRQTMRVLVFRDEPHEVDDVDHPDPAGRVARYAGSTWPRVFPAWGYLRHRQARHQAGCPTPRRNWPTPRCPRPARSAARRPPPTASRPAAPCQRRRDSRSAATAGNGRRWTTGCWHPVADRPGLPRGSCSAPHQETPDPDA